MRASSESASQMNVHGHESEADAGQAQAHIVAEKWVSVPQGALRPGVYSPLDGTTKIVIHGAYMSVARPSCWTSW